MGIVHDQTWSPKL
ncbi:predicted protein [Fibroporia radiculosa]|uniref:Uncharacterized protein n=1 Tax=Fibroporia radiculosa TaxID=599839 RepID=J7S6I5_9APHY|nr:predicted protein [Fibroporia radiculosa]